ncbi:E3 ubiquitin-protein ligase TRIM50 [Aphelenchoides besseyi]|nr:E3 ubiquitin-protein ligase TRIM50 [Aphelenchoides besseyi]KAI6211720.1 E3 ubiquitin-protein ligase TRIM50 [Aphelenchoides besseyi]
MRRTDGPTSVQICEPPPQTSIHDVGCAVCLEAFDLDSRLPKLLPCGHNFCSGCLFSLCLHQEYYLLDKVQCPKCRSTFDATCAMTAPTNYDLCQCLENSQQNITVIHVPDHRSPSSSTSGVGSSMTAGSNTVDDLQINIHDPTEFCFDCRRFVGTTERVMLCRFCTRCYGNGKRVRLTCLECCVNRHNGHQLISLETLEDGQKHFQRELRDLDEQRRKFVNSFKERLAKNRGEELKGLKRAFELINNELSTTIQKINIRFQIEDHLLPPREIRALKQKPFILLARLQRSSNMLQRMFQSTDESYSIDCAVESLCTLAALMDSTAFEDIRQFLVILCSTETPSQVRADVLRLCVRGLIDMLDNQTPSEFLLLFAESFLYCFLALIELSEQSQHLDLWKLVQQSYGELLQSAGLHWPSTSANRVQIVADWSRLCATFGDVCDSATITLLMIETARSRASSDESKTAERNYVNALLKQIDDHLCECRRAQKLAQICVRSRLKQRKRRANWFSCFTPKLLH